MQIRFNIAQAFTLDENFELFAFKRKETALRNYVIKWSFSWRIFPQGEGTRNHARDSSRSPLLHLGRITKFFSSFFFFWVKCASTDDEGNGNVPQETLVSSSQERDLLSLLSLLALY